MAESPVILMIDDNSGEALLLREALSDHGLAEEFHHAANADEALTFLERRDAHEGTPRPDLILLDVKMPRVGGIEMLRRIKDNPETRDIPVVLTSTLASTDEVEAARELGMADYVTKPEGFDGYGELIEHLKPLLPG